MSLSITKQQIRTRHPYINAVRIAAQSFTKRFRNPLQLLEWYFRWTENGRTFYKNVVIIHEYTEKIISDRRRVLYKTNEGDEQNKNKKFDFLRILLESKDENGKGLTDQEIRDEVNTFVFAGHDTTSSGISWAIFNLAKHPDLQEKCRREIELICEDRQEIEWEDLSKMTYVTMFIKESLRLFPPAVAAGKFLNKPLSVKRDLNSPKEVVLPPGSSVYVQISALHRHPDVWENPDEFDPERFTKDNCAKRHPHAFIPFSAGSRNCIGQNFAMNEMKVALSQIVRNFRIYLDDETPEPKLELRVILQSQNGIHVKLKPIGDN